VIEIVCTQVTKPPAAPLGRDLLLASQQVRLLLAKGPVLLLEAGQVDHLGQVRLEQALALPGHAGPYLPEGGLPPAELR
jgi:hypothetical protein